MEITDELKDYSYRTIYDDFFKEKKFITKYIRFFFYCTVFLSVTSLSHTSKFHFFYMFSDYAMFLFRNKRCYSSNYQLFWSCYSYIF